MTAPRPTVHLPASSLLVGAAATSRAALVAGVEDRLDTSGKAPAVPGQSLVVAP